MNKGSIVWLIIFLCTVVFGLAWFKIKGQHAKEVNLLNEEIKNLNQKIEEIKKEKETVFSPPPTPTATPSAEPSPISTPSSFLLPQTDTDSGCTVCGE